MAPRDSGQQGTRCHMSKLWLTAAGLAAAACLSVPGSGLAQERREGPGGGMSDQTRLVPFHFGLGALATWTTDAGKPSSNGNSGGDPKHFGLLLQKLTATANFSASGASLFKGSMSAENLDKLAFDISGFKGMAFGPANGYCGAGAPRFNVSSNATATCFLGCAHGKKTQDPNTGWWTISFEPPFTQYPGCEGGVTGEVRTIELVFDEGTDVGPGSVVLDNVRINNKVFGKPKGSGGDDDDDDDLTLRR